MSLEYTGLQDLLQSDGDAMKFYDALPEHARRQISKRSGHVNSFGDLRAMAENISGLRS
ncbi:MAG: hypothetical protein FWF44_05385 [Defluviitaleaceae bacterium]|nr:hypothetical protein [Defluviitaleaceae bacterium]